MNEKSILASNSIVEHLIRGAIGITALYYAVVIAQSRPLTSLGLGIVMLVAFRGCPACWTLGLIETIHHRLSGKSSADAPPTTCKLPTHRTPAATKTESAATQQPSGAARASLPLIQTTAPRPETTT